MQVAASQTNPENLDTKLPECKACENMCGRYAMALRPSQIRQMLQDNNMPVWDAPHDPDDGDDDGGDGDAGDGDNTPHQHHQQPRQSYNFAPGYNGVVYRADVPDHGAGPHREHSTAGSGDGSHKSSALPQDNSEEGSKGDKGAGDNVHYKLQAMKWGLIPFWTRRNPEYATLLKTINCRDDSLAAGGGMWSSMKARKRCIILAQGFYEWLKVGPKERQPYYSRRKDGKLLCMAGLWDCVQYDGDEHKTYTYTIITTDSNEQLRFLHDRMPVILEPGSQGLRTWLDPSRFEWSNELQSLLRPFDGELQVDAVSKDVNKVGGSSPSYIIPVASKENKSNIANFFAAASSPTKEKQQLQHGRTTPASALGLQSKKSMPSETATQGISASHSRPKRPAELGPINSDEQPPSKKQATPASGKMISATKNSVKSPIKSKPKASDGTQKITKFFAAK